VKGKVFILTVLIGASIFFHGCWNMMDLEKKTFIMMMGIDALPEGQQDKIKVTLTMPVPRQLAGAEGGGGPRPETPQQILQSTGNTVYGTIRQITNRLSRQLYFEHMTAIVIGEEAAKGGLDRFLDVFQRNKDFLRMAKLYICEGKAEDVLKMETEMEPLVVTYINQIVHFNSSRSLRAINYSIGKVITELHETNGNSLVMRIRPEKKEAVVAGSAVIKNWKLVGWLSDRETRGILWMLKEINRISVETSIELQTPQKGLVVLDLVNFTNKTKAKIQDGMPVFYINMRGEARIVEKEERIIKKEENLERYEKPIEQAITKEINNALQKVQDEYRVDVVNFGEHLRKYRPDYWETVKEKWDLMFPHVKVVLNVDVKIRRQGIFK